jgi:hypothetical protein
MGTKVYVSQDLYTLDFVSYIHMFYIKMFFTVCFVGIIQEV